MRAGILSLLIVLGGLFVSPVVAQTPAATPAAAPTARDLAGLWQAKLRFGPDMVGPITIEQDGKSWRAEVAGRSTEAHLTGETLEFELPDGYGGFRGAFTSGQKSLFGHWMDGAPGHWRSASPVTLARVGKTRRWRGVIDPLPTALTMYLKVEPAADGSMRAFLKNPERNFGYVAMRVAALERDGATVRLLSAPRPAKAATASQPASDAKPAQVLTEGKLDDEGTLSIPLPGGTFDFTRVPDGAASDFYPRSRPNAGKDYVYRVPPSLADGWPVAAPEKVGMSRDALVKFVRMIIDAPVDSINSEDVHGVLIARHGTLVLEEYFHGEYRDKPHDTRSASKSVADVLVGAAIEAGVPLSEKSFVYEVMNGGTFPEGLEPRKRALTLEHLLTMSSGLDADDNDDDSPGNEDKVSEQTAEPDFWKLMLGLNMIREPGAKGVYASQGANLVGGVVRRASGRPLVDLFHDLVFEPMQIHRYWLNLFPSGEAYNGGGTRFLPRDFMKFGQLMLNGGTWGGRRIVSADWVKKSTSYHLNIGKGKYAYLWWLWDYPYQGRTLQAFYAGGNGGQVVMGFPELDLVVAFYGGNYNDRVMFNIQKKLVPDYVLPAVVGK